MENVGHNVDRGDDVARAKIELKVQRSHRVLASAPGFDEGEEHAMLESAGSLKVGDILVCREDPELKLRVGSFILSNPPGPGLACVLTRVEGSSGVRAGMTLVPEDEV